MTIPGCFPPSRPYPSIKSRLAAGSTPSARSLGHSTRSGPCPRARRSTRRLGRSHWVTSINPRIASSLNQRTRTGGLPVPEPCLVEDAASGEPGEVRQLTQLPDLVVQPPAETTRVVRRSPPGVQSRPARRKKESARRISKWSRWIVAGCQTAPGSLGTTSRRHRSDAPSILIRAGGMASNPPLNAQTRRSVDEYVCYTSPIRRLVPEEVGNTRFAV
jgi:hypothetical protein